MTSPRVTVVPPTRNRRALLTRALGTVLGQRGVDVEVVVVDDASDDDTSAWFETLDERERWGAEADSVASRWSLA